MSKIIGVTVGTPLSADKIKEKIKPVTSVNGVKADESGNVELEIENGGGSVQSDLSQTDSAAADYVKGVIRQESLPEGYPYKSGMTIEWDGNTEGLYNVNDTYFRVSDVIISNEELKNSKFVMSSGQTGDLSKQWEVYEEAGYIADDYALLSTVLAVRKDNCEVSSISETVTVEKAGVYFAYQSAEIYTASLSFDEVHTIAPEYLKLGKGLTVDENGAIAMSGADAISADKVAFADGETFQQKYDSGELTGPAGKDGAAGPAGADGQPGKDGADGSDGIGISSVTQTTTSNADGGTNIITVTKTDGSTSTFSVKNGSKGSDGQPGQNGADGKTPVKGTDYWTAADKAAMVSDVLAALPTWTGGSY